MGLLTGKTAIITGGASGLGAADAAIFIREGANVVITDIQADLGESVANTHERIEFIYHDVRDEKQWQDVLDFTITKFGAVDILVNNAGLVKFATVEDCSLDDFYLQTQVMIDGTFLGCKTAIPYIAKSGGGSIINMSSVAAKKGISVIPAYSAAKGAIISMSRSIAVHCQEQGNNIRVNSVVPGAHDTPMTQQAMAELTGGEDAGLDQVQAHGQGKPEDVANLVLYLASDLAKQITGTDIVIDNGETMK